MDDLGKEFTNNSNKINIDENIYFEAQLVAALMVETNALIPIKTASKLCSLSRQEIDRRIQRGTFPEPRVLSSEDNAIRKAFRLHDLQNWIDAPADYRSPQ